MQKNNDSARQLHGSFRETSVDNASIAIVSVQDKL